MKKLILVGCKCRNNSTIGGDWIINANDVEVNLLGDKIYFITKTNTLYLEYRDEDMAREASYKLNDAMCDPLITTGFKMPIWVQDGDYLEYWPAPEED